MRLHTNADAFSAILEFNNKSTGIRIDVLEKDYYVTLLLKELSEWQAEFPVYFKGGTALYKALGSIRRFSVKSKRLDFSENINLNKIQTSC